MASPSPGESDAERDLREAEERLADILSRRGGELPKFVSLLGAVIADAPEEGGSSEWDKQAVLAALDEVKRREQG
ncbi:hypothetical protein [Streptomyces sp. NPDC047974]|uniref:hypothetical protein n=1 Tax=Streptomyces sp. NPDC047974 TaxID=3154343 RepID=UPI0033E2639F